MTALISMLRGVNVGGHHKIKMETLRAIYEALGLHQPQTFIQSGNVVFATKERDLTRLAARIEKDIEQSFGFRPAVIVRTCAELREVVARNPFLGRTDFEPGKLLINFLAGPPTAEVQAKVLAIQPHPEELHLSGRELYAYFPNGMGRSTLGPAMDRALKMPVTGRNWNTVMKLLEMAEELQSSL